MAKKKQKAEEAKNEAENKESEMQAAEGEILAKQPGKSGFIRAAEFLFKHSLLIVLLCVAFLAFLNYAEYKQALMSFDFSQLNLNKFFAAILFLIIAINLVKYIKTLLYKAISKREHFDEGLRYSILKITGYAGWVIALWGAVAILGIKTENLAILVGALSVGIGFGLQNIVNNFISGIIVLFERPMQKGDWIIIGGKEGIVKSIKIRSTELTAFDGTSILIPNADILSGSLINVTHGDCMGRITISLSVAYGTDLYKVRQMLLDIAAANKEVLKDPAPLVWITNFGDNGIEMDLKFNIGNVNNRGSIKTDVMLTINDAFNKEGIVIPFPQRDVHITKEE